MSKRTQSEVNALWPVGLDAYVFEGEVSLPAASKESAAALLQYLYDMEGGVAGDFIIREELGVRNEQGVFKVEFARDVPDDSPIVNSALLGGNDFQTVLAKQFISEIDDARKRRGLAMTVKLLGPAVFKKLPI